MYRYETHLHTSPASRCARATVEETLGFYRDLGYAGVFITNHFVDSNVGCDPTLPLGEKLDFFFADYHRARELAPEYGLCVMMGVELSYRGTDFLAYGLDEAWYYGHMDIIEMRKSELLPMMMDEGALVIHAHPYREASYIDHIRLFPRAVHGVEVINACRTEGENAMARLYANHYGHIHFAGSDNHVAGRIPRLAGLEFDTPITSEADFVTRVKAGEGKIFANENPLKK